MRAINSFRISTDKRLSKNFTIIIKRHNINIIFGFIDAFIGGITINSFSS